MPVVEANEQSIRIAGDRLRDGLLVAFPTETVYGLGADALNGRAVAAIYATKGRPSFNPLIVHVASLEAARDIAIFEDAAERLAFELWPGPLTLVLKKREDAAISDLVTAGLDTIALRVPDHPIARAVLAAAHRPIAAPSANRSGRVSPTQASHVDADFGADGPMILDGGATAHGVESTIVDASVAGRLTLLRPGAIPRETITQLTGLPLEEPKVNPIKPIAPGLLESHYAPNARVRLNARDVRAGEALLAFGPDVPATTGPVINLSPQADLIEAASVLFAALRKLDAAGVATIAVMPIPNDGLGEAINDRLMRAAAPRG